MKFRFVLTLFILLSLGKAIAKIDPDQEKFKFIADNTVCQKHGNMWQCRSKEKLFIHSQFGKLPVNITMLKILNGKDNPISMLVTLDESHKQYWVTDCLFQINLKNQPISLKTKLVEGINSGRGNIASINMPVFDKSDLRMLVKSDEISVFLHVKDLNSLSNNSYSEAAERLSVRESTHLQTLVLGMLMIQE